MVSGTNGTVEFHSTRSLAYGRSGIFNKIRLVRVRFQFLPTLGYNFAPSLAASTAKKPRRVFHGISSTKSWPMWQ